MADITGRTWAIPSRRRASASAAARVAWVSYATTSAVAERVIAAATTTVFTTLFIERIVASSAL
jgi:hypothetical protein